MTASAQSSAKAISPLTQKLGRFYLLYLGLLPVVATFAVQSAHSTRFPMLVFLGGVGAVGVYLAATYSYTRLPARLLPLLLMLLDGPLFVLVALRNDFHPLAFAIEGYLIDGTAIWVAILILAGISPLPTQTEYPPPRSLCGPLARAALLFVAVDLSAGYTIAFQRCVVRNTSAVADKCS